MNAFIPLDSGCKYLIIISSPAALGESDLNKIEDRLRQKLKKIGLDEVEVLSLAAGADVSAVMELDSEYQSWDLTE